MGMKIGDNVLRRIFMKKKQLPSKREIVPTSSESTPKLRAIFTDAFKPCRGQSRVGVSRSAI